MWAIQTTVSVAPDGTVTLEMPTDIPPGEYHAVLVITEAVGGGGPEVSSPAPTSRPLDFSLDDIELGPGTPFHEEKPDERRSS